MTDEEHENTVSQLRDIAGKAEDQAQKLNNLLYTLNELLAEKESQENG